MVARSSVARAWRPLYHCGLGYWNESNDIIYHPRRLRQIRNYVTQEVMAQLVTSLVHSSFLVLTRLYCNSALAGLPASALARLQRVQNAVARLVFNLDRRYVAHHSSITAVAQCTVKYTASSSRSRRWCMHILHDRCLSYLADLGYIRSTRQTLNDVNSCVTNQSCSHETNTDASWQTRLLSLSVVPASIWNSLPPAPAVRNIDSHPAFRRALKSHLFYCAFIA